ncbi:MAG: single-stranded-DNA-specific exonuclease RecJ [bacterium]
MKTNWLLKENLDFGEVTNIANRLNIEKTTAELAMSKNYRTPDEIYSFLNPELSNLHDPFLFTQMERAVERIVRAVKAKEKILIYGDYDVDGTTGTAFLYHILKKMGTVSDFYIPNRVSEGYGLTEAGVEYCMTSSASLIITVDCGMGAGERVKLLQKNGKDVIIIDHHEGTGEILPAVAVINSKIENYPFRELSACGIVFKLGQAIFERTKMDKEELWNYLDLVALATVCDVTPLIDENRIFVKEGLKVLSKTKNIGLQKLMEKTRLSGQKLSPYQLGFILGPRINAKGRLGDAKETVNLFTTQDGEEASKIGQALENENNERQKIQKQIIQEAEQEIKDVSEVIIIAKEGWHPGVIGIAASKLADKFYRPTMLIALNGDIGRGSARSIPEFNIYEALSKCKELFSAFGGHKAAAGFTIKKENIPLLKDRIIERTNIKVLVKDLIPKIIIDKKLSIQSISEKLVNELEKIEPFGCGNSKPMFVSTGLQVIGYPRIVGNNHIKFKVRGDNKMGEVIGFGLKEMLMGTGEYIDLVYELKRENRGANSKIMLYAKDIDKNGKRS